MEIKIKNVSPETEKAYAGGELFALNIMYDVKFELHTKQCIYDCDVRLDNVEGSPTIKQLEQMIKHDIGLSAVRVND